MLFIKALIGSIMTNVWRAVDIKRKLVYTNYIKRANHLIYSAQSTMFSFSQFLFFVGPKWFIWLNCEIQLNKKKRKEKKMKAGIESERARVPELS